MDEINYESVFGILVKTSKEIKGNTKCTEKDSVNFFQLLGIEYKEVLICRMLGAILDPESILNNGEANLKSFCKDVLECNIDNEKYLSVKLEDYIDSGRRCDIVVRAGSTVIPIEVKIFACDQDKQLFDYHSYYFKNKEGVIYYLTPDEHKPSKNSISDGISTLTEYEQYKCLTFGKILTWIKNVHYGEDSDKEYMVRQFEEVIKKMKKNAAELLQLYDGLQINDWSKFCEISGAITRIIANPDEVRKKIIKSYLSDKLIVPDGYEKTFNDSDDTNDKNCVAYIKKDNGIILKVCVETNLYVYLDENYNGKVDSSEWMIGEHGYWRYIKPSDYNGKSYKLRGEGIINCSRYTGKIDLSDILKKIDENASSLLM